MDSYPQWATRSKTGILPVIGPRPARTPALQIRWRRRCLTKLVKQSTKVHLSTEKPDGTSVAPIAGVPSAKQGGGPCPRGSKSVAATGRPTYAVG